MNVVEEIKRICKERKIPISTLERNCGFANGYLGQLKKGTMPADRLKKVCDFLELDIEEMLGSKNYEFDYLTKTWECNLSKKEMQLIIEVISDKNYSERLLAYAKKLLELKNMEEF